MIPDVVVGHVSDHFLSAIGTVRFGQNSIQVCIVVVLHFIKMGRHPIPICGFGHVILYDESSDFKVYQFTMKDNPKMTDGITATTFNHYRKKTKKFLNDP